MTDSNGRPDFAALLAPLEELRASLVVRRGELTAELGDVRERLAEIDRVLKAAGIIEREPRGPQKPRKTPKGMSSPGSQEKVLAFVESQREVTSRDVANATGLSTSYSSKVLTDLRDLEKIRLIRNEPSSPDGRGHRPIYGPWPGGGRS